MTLPYSMIEPLRDVLDSGVQSDVDEKDVRWINSIRADIVEARLPLTANLLEKSITLRDVLAFKQGDIIPLEEPDKMIVFANGIPIADAKLGVRNGHVALRIAEFRQRKVFNFNFGDLI